VSSFTLGSLSSKVWIVLHMMVIFGLILDVQKIEGQSNCFVIIMRIKICFNLHGRYSIKTVV